MNKYYMDVLGNVKDSDEWIKLWMKKKLKLFYLKDLKEVIWHGGLQRWMTI